MEKSSLFLRLIGYGIMFCVIFGIPIYFLWNTILDLFHDIPSNQAEFRRLFELEHGILFYTFACVILLYIAFKAFGVTLTFLVSLNETSSIRNKFFYVLFWLGFITSLILPILSYFIIGNNLYSDFQFSFTGMLNYIGFFELYILFVVIFEAFILDVGIISFIVRICMYGYLIYLF